jgi:hypothetical protein
VIWRERERNREKGEKGRERERFLFLGNSGMSGCGGVDYFGKAWHGN